MAIDGKQQDVREEQLPTPMAQADAPEKSFEVDTMHNDEAMKVLANYTGDEGSEEKRLTKKIDRRLLPILCLTYALQYYDKAMISQAAIFGLREDLNLTGNRYSMSSAIFHLGFVGGAYPASQIAQRYPVERVAAALIIVWGVCFISTAGCHNWQSLYAQRFFLGLVEAGISPIFMLVVGQFYKKNEQALRMGVWYCTSGFISTLSPIVNYGLGHITGSLSPWRYMYIVGGILTILWTFPVLFYLPPDPIRAKGFTERERYIAVARLRVNNAGVRNTHFKKRHVLELLIDEKFWIIFAFAFLSFIAAGPINAFIPIILAGFGFSTLNSLLLMMPAGFIAV
ncbi:uncharacterized protein Z518_09653 [Rhinocladiella mackenziei CBS 650.93]|uniref:Rhinocladiella mackenziei CBS 650.93 unplaced genomic scaffold supercont1.8, whole genome shotgun sequence n=1 Tax=Rhinocladiella mackenziei CBS 650.93 TaxID=1442369 RepID=A0A0D2GQM4_9EURO|nr:uncharacterized protein Z518_09653 [Rhinocladiella mackenziei CBS 650.93]KIX00588.1 hypothetical protein Z518_09653 [Rhinocladiella mackenziei CBS 650.93]